MHTAPFPFAEYCILSHQLNAKQASEGGIWGMLQNAPAPVLGALAGGAGGLITGAFSDKPGSMLRHGLIGAGLGGLAGWGGSSLMNYLNSAQGSQAPEQMGPPKPEGLASPAPEAGADQGAGRQLDVASLGGAPTSDEWSNQFTMPETSPLAPGAGAPTSDEWSNQFTMPPSGNFLTDGKPDGMVKQQSAAPNVLQDPVTGMPIVGGAVGAGIGGITGATAGATMSQPGNRRKNALKGLLLGMLGGGALGASSGLLSGVSGSMAGDAHQAARGAQNTALAGLGV